MDIATLMSEAKAGNVACAFRLARDRGYTRVEQLLIFLYGTDPHPAVVCFDACQDAIADLAHMRRLEEEAALVHAGVA